MSRPDVTLTTDDKDYIWGAMEIHQRNMENGEWERVRKHITPCPKYPHPFWRNFVEKIWSLIGLDVPTQIDYEEYNRLHEQNRKDTLLEAQKMYESYGGKVDIKVSGNVCAGNTFHKTFWKNGGWYDDNRRPISIEESMANW